MFPTAVGPLRKTPFHEDMCNLQMMGPQTVTRLVLFDPCDLVVVVCQSFSAFWSTGQHGDSSGGLLVVAVPLSRY